MLWSWIRRIDRFKTSEIGWREIGKSGELLGGIIRGITEMSKCKPNRKKCLLFLQGFSLTLLPTCLDTHRIFYYLTHKSYLIPYTQHRVISTMIFVHPLLIQLRRNVKYTYTSNIYLKSNINWHFTISVRIKVLFWVHKTQNYGSSVSDLQIYVLTTLFPNTVWPPHLCPTEEVD